MNLWKLFFGKGPKEHFLDFDPADSHWRVVTWNFDVKTPTGQNRIIELHKDSVKVIEWQKDDVSEVKFFESGMTVGKSRMQQTNPELLALMNIAVHSTLKHSLEVNHEFMVTPVTGATTQDILNETKALLWIQATFGTLARALDGFNADQNLILTAAFFSGLIPGVVDDKRENVLRIIIFNLDITYSLLADHSLSIIIFDDRDLGHGESKAPTFQQIIKVTKPQFYDEIVRLVHRLAQVGEIN